MQILRIFKKLFQCLIGAKHLRKKKDINKKNRRIAGTLMNIFKQLVLHKTRKRECKHPEWMNLFIIFSLKKKQ